MVLCCRFIASRGLCTGKKYTSNEYFFVFTHGKKRLQLNEKPKTQKANSKIKTIWLNQPVEKIEMFLSAPAPFWERKREREKKERIRRNQRESKRTYKQQTNFKLPFDDECVVFVLYAFTENERCVLFHLIFGVQRKTWASATVVCFSCSNSSFLLLFMQISQFSLAQFSQQIQSTMFIMMCFMCSSVYSCKCWFRSTENVFCKWSRSGARTAPPTDN